MNKSNIRVRQNLTNAMISLMGVKKFRDISITELIETAHVGRVSFYRNYECKEDVVIEYLCDQVSEWAEVLRLKNRAPEWADLSKAITILKPSIKILYESEAGHILYMFIKQFNDRFQLYHNDDTPTKSIRAGLYFGIIDYWATNGFKETSKEIEKKFTGYIRPINDQSK